MDIFKKSEKGMALPAVIMVMLITFTLSAAVLTMATSQVNTEISYETNTQALQAAEAGLNMYLWYINKEGASIELDTVITYPDANPKYAFILHEIDATNALKKVTSTGWAIHNPDITKTVSATFKRKSFTEYVYFTDQEPEEIWWRTGEYCYGPYRSNSNIYISGEPVFYGEVYYANDIKLDKNSYKNNPKFTKGIFQEKAIPFPTTNQMLKDLAEDEGLYFEGRTSIMMNPNGTLTIWNPGNGKNEEPPKTYNIPKNGVIYVNSKAGANLNDRFSKAAGNVFISGKLKGRLTVAAANDIYITDYDPTEKYFLNNWWYNKHTNGVTYANTDFVYDDKKKEYRVTGTGNDMLGLIANRDVVLLTKGWFDSNDWVTSSGDIRVYAAVMAINGSFRNSHHENYPSNGTEKVILRGALIQKKRGAVGSFTYYGTNKGYIKDYGHDIRMTAEQPPNFLEPENSGWEISAWQ